MPNRAREFVITPSKIEEQGDPSLAENQTPAWHPFWFGFVMGLGVTILALFSIRKPVFIQNESPVAAKASNSRSISSEENGSKK